MRARLRSEGVVRRHDVKAADATATARSTSAAPDTGASAKASPVLGSISGAVGPSSASQYAPPTKFCSLRIRLLPILPVVPHVQDHRCLRSQQAFSPCWDPEATNSA